MEQVFNKDGITRYVYKAADAVRLHSQGWTEGEAPSAPPSEPDKKSEHDKEGKDDPTDHSRP